MTPAALLFTVLFIADDPSLSMVVIDVKEDSSGRAVDVVVVPRDRPALVAHVQAGPAETPPGARTLRTWPLLPPGASLNPAGDGAILTVDDVGLWEDPTPPPAPKGAKPPKPSMVPPDLRVASPTTLRLYLPAITDDPSSSSSSSPASLHGSHTRVAGTALIVRRPTAVLALSTSNGEADGGPALITASTPGACAPIPTRVVQTLTSLTSTSTTCTGSLAISRATGKRYGDKPDKDAEAAGVVVVRLPPPSPAPVLKPPPKGSPGR